MLAIAPQRPFEQIAPGGAAGEANALQLESRLNAARSTSSYCASKLAVGVTPLALSGAMR